MFAGGWSWRPFFLLAFLSSISFSFLNVCRGVVLEALGRFEEAIQDYRAVLAAAPNDPAAWNNLGNATAGAPRLAGVALCAAADAGCCPRCKVKPGLIAAKSVVKPVPAWS